MVGFEQVMYQVDENKQQFQVCVAAYRSSDVCRPFQIILTADMDTGGKN